MATTFTGIGSGVDFTALIDQAVAAEKAPIAKLETRKTDANRKATILGDLITKLKALDLKAKELDSSDELFGQTGADAPTVRKALVSDATKMRADVMAGASIGSHTIRPIELSAGQVNRSVDFESNEAGVAGMGSFGITVAGQSRVDIDFEVTDTLDDIATKINGSGAKVHASVARDGTNYNLVLTGQPGASNTISFDTLAGPDLGFSMDEAQTARDARFLVDGTEYRSATNSVSNVIDGVTFHLLDPTNADLQLTIADVPQEGTSTPTSPSSTALSKVQALVGAYNDVAKVLQTQLTDDGAGNQNKLFGDLTLQGLQRGLGIAVSSSYAHDDATVSAGKLGITLARDGTLSVDATKFTKAVEADSRELESFIYGNDGEGGLVAQLGSIVERFTTSSTGVLSSRQSMLKSESRRYDEQIDRIETRASEFGDRLTKQFTALDRLMVNLNSQTSYISALFGGV